MKWEVRNGTHRMVRGVERSERDSVEDDISVST